MEKEEHSPLKEEKHSPPMVEEVQDPTSYDYELVDEIIAYENEGIQISHCDINALLSALKRFIYTKKDDEDIISSVAFLLLGIYLWSEDYVNNLNVFIPSIKNLNYKITELRSWQPYLSIIIFFQKMLEFNSKETFYEEFVLYSQHKKMILDRLYRSFTTNTKPLDSLNDNDNGFLVYLKTTYYRITGGELEQKMIFYNYAIHKNVEHTMHELLLNEELAALSKPKSVTQKQNQKKKAKSGTPKKQEKKTKSSAAAAVMEKSSAAAVPQTHVYDSGVDFKMVEERVVRIRYLLKTQDYDLIKNNITEIIQPLCVEGCTARFRDGQSGKYVRIVVRGVEVAHISYYHHSQHLYHFKIDVPSYFGLADRHPLNYTVPFNFHISEGTITFATRDIDNPDTEIKCSKSIISKVRECLERHVGVLNSIDRMARGMRKSRSRYRRRIRTRKRRFHK
jgi:hypothetical protein